MAGDVLVGELLVAEVFGGHVAFFFFCSRQEEDLEVISVGQDVLVRGEGVRRLLGAGDASSLAFREPSPPKTLPPALSFGFAGAHGSSQREYTEGHSH